MIKEYLTGLIKVEHQGGINIVLAFKMYYCDKDKYFNKKQNELTKQKYLSKCFSRIVHKNSSIKGLDLKTTR
jgi:hypothetical protein